MPRRAWTQDGAGRGHVQPAAVGEKRVCAGLDALARLMAPAPALRRPPIRIAATLSTPNGPDVQVQMHPYDLFFFDPASGQYTVKRWLADLRARYGGIDAALIWPTYPQLGVDDRNAYDMIRSMPGGVTRVRDVVQQLHAEGVRVLWPLMPWDTATRFGGPEPHAMINLTRETDADGVNGDTLYTIPRGFWDESVKAGHPLALQAELGGTLTSLAWTNLGWGESGGWSLPLGAGGPPDPLGGDGAGGGSAATGGAAPSVDLFKWLEPRRMTTICRRWDTDRTDAIQHAWFNGIGYVAWENVWVSSRWDSSLAHHGLRRLKPLHQWPWVLSGSESLWP